MKDSVKQNEKAIVNSTIKAIIKVIEKAKSDNYTDQQRVRSNTDGMQDALMSAYGALDRIHAAASKELI